MKVNYKCKDNDVKLQFHCKNDIIDEIWVKVEGESAWTVIGYEDLQNGIKKSLKKLSETKKINHDRNSNNNNNR